MIADANDLILFSVRIKKEYRDFLEELRIDSKKSMQNLLEEALTDYLIRKGKIKSGFAVDPEIKNEGQAVFAIRMEDAFKTALEGYESRIDGGAFLDVLDFVRVESEHMYEDCPQFDPTSNAPRIVEHLVQLAKINQSVHGKPPGIIDREDMQGAVASYLGIFETTGEKPTDIFMKK